MKACLSCGATFVDELRACPSCSKRFGRLLAKPLRAPENLVKVTMDVIRKIESRWGFGSFAAGWRLLDIFLRISLTCVLISMAIFLSVRVEDSNHVAHERLASHRTIIADGTRNPRPLTSDELAQVMLNYQRLEASCEEMIETQTRDARLHVVVMALLVILLLASAVAQYRAYRETNAIKAAISFLCSPEGEPFVAQLQKRETDKRKAIQPESAPDAARVQS
ncbi:MAG: hypothetical protein HYY16_08315 [Planctomycetes bacterium]|nr:hypothetical protein [Planctomycetota bacterium]